MKKLFSTAIIICMLALTSQAQFYQQCPKQTATGLSATAQFGSAVALSSDATTAIVGAPGDLGEPGAAIIWNRTGSVWTQGQTLVGTGAIFGANQGFSVAISSDGNTAIVGGPSDNSDEGAAWIFTRSGGVWSQQGNKLVGSGALVASQGFSVSISGDGNTAVIGGPFDGNTSRGALWVFARSGTSWTQVGTKLVGSGAATGSSSVQEGFSVAISVDGQTIVSGAPSDGSSGSAWIYAKSGGAWIQQGAKLNTINAEDLGSSAALSSDGNTVAIGDSRNANNVGAVFIYARTGTTWSFQDKLIGLLPVGKAQQGCSVDLSSDGNTVVFGGAANIYTPTAGDIGEGATWVFKRSGSVWSQYGSKFVGIGAIGNSQQGSGVGISDDGKTFVTGGFGDNNFAGAIWVFSETIPQLSTDINDAMMDDQSAVYPNPAIDKLYINLNLMPDESTNILITDIVGKIEKATTIIPSSKIITEDISQLNSGIHILILRNSNGVRTYKFSKQ